MVHDVGYLDCGMTGSLELVVFCNEIIGWLKKYFRELEISKETLALDLIHQVGPDGYFLDSDHTLNHVRDDWRPILFDRLDYQMWEEKGQVKLIDRAKKSVQEILETVQPYTLPPDIEKNLQAVIEG